MADDDVWDDTKVLSQGWRAQPNDLIGGWCVTFIDDPRTPADGAPTIADFVSRDVAQYIADIHNDRLTNRPTDWVQYAKDHLSGDREAMLRRMPPWLRDMVDPKHHD